MRAIRDWRRRCAVAAVSGLLWTGCGPAQRSNPQEIVAWSNLQSVLEPPATPPSWRVRTPTTVELEVYQQGLGLTAAATALKLQTFISQFPQSPHAKEARAHEWDLLQVAAQTGQTQILARLGELEHAKLQDPTTPQAARLEIRIRQIQRRVEFAGASTDAGSIQLMEEELGNLQLEFPTQPEPWHLLLGLGELWLRKGNPDRARGITSKIRSSSIQFNDLFLRRHGSLETKLARLGQPLSFNLQTIGGGKLSLQQSEAKVFLLHFWSHRSPVTLRGMQALKDLYQKFHSAGLQIVSLSVEDKLVDVEQWLSTNPLPWPQVHADAQNELARYCGVTSVPDLWLLDSKGIVRSFHSEADADLLRKLTQMLQPP